MKPYTKLRSGDTIKYPVVSQGTGNTYEVVIRPYCRNEERYLEGCVATLKKKWFIFSRELTQKHFDNDNGKISISYWSTDETTKTTLDYNMVNMARLIVNIYEDMYKDKNNSISQMKNDFKEFSKWDGVIQ